MLQAMWYDAKGHKWRYLVEPSFGGLRTDASQMPGTFAWRQAPVDRIGAGSLVHPPMFAK